MDAEERELFRGAIEAVLTRHNGDDAVRVLADEGWDEVRADDEAFAFGALFEAAGRKLSTAPLLDLAAATVVAAARPALTALPPPADDGKTRVDVLVAGVPAAGSELVARVAGDGSWVRIPFGELAADPVQGLDPSFAVHRVHGQVADPERVGDGDTLLALLRRCAGHQLVGLAERAEGVAREHVLVREQFGRAIGTWQTVQHRLADARVEVAAARAALEAAWHDSSPVLSAAAKAQAGLAATTASTAAQQLLGAIGFTWEHDIHLVVRRAAVLDAALGSPAQLSDEIAHHLLNDPDWEPIHVDL